MATCTTRRCTGERVKAPATECARYSAAFLEEERRNCPEEYFRQKYLCEFGDTADTVFDRDLVGVL